MDDHTQSLSHAVPRDGPALRKWGPFDLLECVGRGGFGEVYRAFDPTLQRHVAVKLLLPTAEHADEQAAAILRESRAMARVIHPNVVPIYGVATYDGRVGFWSAFVRGKTLSALLAINGPFGPREASHIGVDLCKALSAVHAAGLLHRDIKPGNAMREEGGRIVLMDFGLTHDRETHKSFGGTPGFIAPELRAGGKATVRSDVYAMGVLLYQLLTGLYPPTEAGATWSLLEQRPDLPSALVRAIHTAIDNDPEKRFSSAAQMAAALSDAGGETLPPPRVAKRAASTRWRRALAVAAIMIAIAIAASYRFRSGHAVPAGIYQRYDQAHDLVQHYYRPNALKTAIPMLESIVHDEPSFAAGFADLGRANFLQFSQMRDPSYVEPTRKACLDAIAIDPNQAAAHVTLSLLYAQLGKNDLASHELDIALRVDRTDAEAWGARAELYQRRGDTSQVEPAFRKAIDLAPSDWRWPKQLADYYTRTGRYDLAIQTVQEAVRLAPDNARAYNNLGMALWYARRLPEARAALEKALTLEPGYNSYSNLGMVLRDLGDYAAATTMFEKAAGLHSNDYRAWGLLADIYRHTDPVKARETYKKSIALGEELRKTKPREASLLADLGTMYAAIGDSAKCIPLMRQAAALQPENGEVLFMAGVAFETIHRRADAIQFIADALRHGYSRQSVDSLPELAALRSDRHYIAIAGSLR